MKNKIKGLVLNRWREDLGNGLYLDHVYPTFGYYLGRIANRLVGNVNIYLKRKDLLKKFSRLARYQVEEFENAVNGVRYVDRKDSK